VLDPYSELSPTFEVEECKSSGASISIKSASTTGGGGEEGGKKG